MNKSLKDLDLRNNQITHTSATELSSAIETNNSIETLGNSVYFCKKIKKCFIEMIEKTCDGIILDWLVVNGFWPHSKKTLH